MNGIGIAIGTDWFKTAPLKYFIIGIKFGNLNFCSRVRISIGIGTAALIQILFEIKPGGKSVVKTDGMKFLEYFPPKTRNLRMSMGFASGKNSERREGKGSSHQ